MDNSYFLDEDFDLSLIMDNVSDCESGSTSQESGPYSQISDVSTSSDDLSIFSTKRKSSSSSSSTVNQKKKPQTIDHLSTGDKNDQPITKRKRRRYPNAKDANGN